MLKSSANKLFFSTLALGGLLAVAVALRAVAQQPAAENPPPPASTASAPASAPAAATPAAATGELPPEEESLRQSADNNVSFPVDI